MSIYINPVLDNSPDDPRLDDDAVIVSIEEYEDMKTEAIEEKWREEKKQMEILTIKQMQQQLLLAYQTTKNKLQMQLHFGFDTQGEPSIDVWFHGGSEQNPCENIMIYEYLDDYNKMALFNKAIACINGSEDPFAEGEESK